MSLFELTHRPELDAPVLVVALEGWIDAGLAAEGAASVLAERLDLDLVATFDTDALLDYRARRPIMHLHDGVNTDLTWSSIDLYAAHDVNGRAMLLLLGVEPDHAWRAFCDQVVELARSFGTRMMCGLGAYPAAVPHTRPVLLSATASTDELAASVGLLRGSIDVPAGVEAAIEQACAEVRLPALGLWAQVPHYAATMRYPAASLALIEGLEQVAGLSLEKGTLPTEAETSEKRINELVASNPEHAEMVHQLELHADSMRTDEGDRLPSGDELAAELQKFLREQGD